MNIFIDLLKKSFRSWQKDKASQLAASTAYYTVFSLAPLLITIISIAGLLFDANKVQAQLLREIGKLVGVQGAETVGSMLTAAHASPHSVLAAIIGTTTLLLGATGLMVALQNAVNFIWKVETKPGQSSIVRTLFKRFFSLGLILAVGFLLLVSLVVSASVSFLATYITTHFFFPPIIISLADFGISYGIILLLFVLLLKYLPDIQIPWKAVWPGAALTALLFTIGKSVLGWYLGQKNFTSAYGVAGSLIILLLWINYSAQIFFFGVEFTKVHGEQTRRVLKPKPYAQFIGQSKNASYPRGFPVLDAVLGIGALFVELKFFKFFKIFKRKKE